MTEAEEIALARSLSPGARRALPFLTEDWSFPSRKTYNAAGAFNLTTRVGYYGRLAEQKLFGGRYGYRRTPIGSRIAARLEALNFHARTGGLE
jgi:hypothetical protein